jgi:hypothetical protein
MFGISHHAILLGFANIPMNRPEGSGADYEIPSGLSATRKLWQKSRWVLVNANRKLEVLGLDFTGNATYQDL